MERVVCGVSATEDDEGLAGKSGVVPRSVAGPDDRKRLGVSKLWFWDAGGERVMMR